MPKFFEKQPPEMVEVSFEDEQEEIDPAKVYLNWRAPARPFRKKDRSYYTTIAIIVVLAALISLLMREYLFIGVLMAIAFVAYVLGFVPPEEVENKISHQGITIGGHFYFWEELDSFWFTEKEGDKILHILTHLRFPGQLMLVLGDQKEEEARKILAKFLPYHEVAPKSLIDDWGGFIQKHFPMENPQR